MWVAAGRPAHLAVLLCGPKKKRKKTTERGRGAALPLPSSSTSLAARQRIDVALMPHSSTSPPVGTDAAAADPSPHSRRSEGGSAGRPEGGGGGGGSEDFILDSGAAVHATARADLLSDPRPPVQGTAVRTRVGGTLPVLAVGCVRTPRFVVPQVHHAPGLKNGGCGAVVSVRQLARRGLAVTFGAESCSVREQSTGAVVGEGRLREGDGFYHLDYLRVPES